MTTAETKQKSVTTRKMSLAPSAKIIDQALTTFPSKSPIELVSKLIQRMGYSLATYDQACNRAERFIKNGKSRRMPSHIKEKFVLMRLVESCVAKRYPTASVTITAAR